MNIQQVIYVMEVYNYQSFTEAAKALFISQPRLSQAIRDLEYELGFEIFERSKKGISGPTVRGYEFIEQARILLRQFSQLESLKMSNQSTFQLATMRLSHAQDAFIRLCSEVQNDPHLNMDLWFCTCYEAADRIRTTASELAVVTIIDDLFEDWLYFFGTKKIEFHELNHSAAHVTLSRNCRLANKEIIHTDDLHECTYISEKRVIMNELALKLYAVVDSICPDSRITVSSTDMMYRLASENAESNAFIFEPIPPSQKTLDRYGLISIPLEEAFKARLGYLTVKDHTLSRMASRYLELLHDEISQSYSSSKAPV